MIITAAVLEMAYWQAARVMCSRCAQNVPVIKLTHLDDTVELIHKTNHTTIGVIEENCQAAPIHELIERLNKGE